MAQLNFEKEIVNYRNRFLKSVVFDLLIRFGKTEIRSMVDKCVSEIEGDRCENSGSSKHLYQPIGDGYVCIACGFSTIPRDCKG